MQKVKIEGCAHGSFACEHVDVKNVKGSVAIIRCADCGVAIGAFNPEQIDVNSLLLEFILCHTEAAKIFTQAKTHTP